MTSLFATLAIMAACAFLVGAFYDTETRKHLFTFNLLFDMLVIADVSACAVVLGGVRSGKLTGGIPAGGWKLATVLILAVFVGTAALLYRAYKVWPSRSHLAVGRPAAQSSNQAGSPQAGANSAVDGNVNGNYYDGSVTATNADPNAWWQVDLGASKPIHSVVIWNRTDCCMERLQDFWVFICDAPFRSDETPATLEAESGGRTDLLALALAGDGQGQRWRLKP
ncbi:MAG TPA: discoidin domain-containing protein [Bryobacteraceae bacterium]|nr:discoidin domain-containing protein [Bryobacteraceae bacterium]